jgi:hypothetical protein
MRSRSRSTRAAWVLLAVLPLAAPAGARQQKAPPAAADWAKWESLGAGTRSPDGKWLACPVVRSSGEKALRVRSLADETSKSIADGDGPAFSDDSRWLA